MTPLLAEIAENTRFTLDDVARSEAFHTVRRSLLTGDADAVAPVHPTVASPLPRTPQTLGIASNGLNDFWFPAKRPAHENHQAWCDSAKSGGGANSPHLAPMKYP